MNQKNIKPVRAHKKKLFLFLVAAVAAGSLYLFAKSVLHARDAFLFAHPLVIMDVTGSLGERGSLTRKRDFPDADFRRVVRPNVDTLYTSGFFNTSDGPWVFEMAENNQRYEVMQFMDGWTNVFASLGTRTHGTKGGLYLIVGPDWEGETPEQLTLIRSPTDIVWMIGRTQTNGPQDLPLVHRLQDGLTLRTYEDWLSGRQERTSTTKRSTRESTAKIVNQMNTRDFFNKFSLLLDANPPYSADKPMVKKLAKLGIDAGVIPDWNRGELLLMEAGRKLALRTVRKVLEKERSQTHGWIIPAPTLGRYGTDYVFRAIVSMVGLGANMREDAIYLQGKTDNKGRTLSGSKRYRIHFEKGNLPPVNAFWSITAYGSDHYLIDNPIDRYSLGKEESLVKNPDGSIDIWIQAEQPSAENESNWLPVKQGENFALSTRLYWPKAEILDGTWSMPPIESLD